jgi:HEAT repeat protein
MRKWLKIILLCLLFAMAALIILETADWWLIRSKLKEPIYQNRTLSEWVSVYFSGYSGYSPHATLQEETDAEQAIRAMGTNTIPVLLQWLSKNPPTINQRSTALQVFQILGNEGQAAVPALIELTKSNDKDIRYYALDCLLAVKPEDKILISALIPMVHDPDKNIKFVAAEKLVDLDANAAEKAGVFVDFPQLKTLLETNDIKN